MLIIRDGIIHAEICGEHLLVATRPARPQCKNPALQLNDVGYFIWELLEQRMDRPAIRDAYSEKYHVSASRAQEVVAQFLEALLCSGYLYETEAAL